MDAILTVLSQLGLGLATNAVYDLLKSMAGQQTSEQQLAAEIQNRIDLNGVSMSAKTVIDALARHGFIAIQNSHLYAPAAINFGSVTGGASMGNNTIFRTNTTQISAGIGASMNTEGNAQVRQNADGSISFHVGEGGNINIKVGK